MFTIDDVPELAICPKCGNPMKVVFLEPLATKLGFKVDEGAFSIECCGGELTIDDNDLANRLKEVLLAYHQKNCGETPSH